MQTEFSEFSYSYAVTETLRRSGVGRFTAAPVIPPLTIEGDVFGGFDLGVEILGTPVLLQFKVPQVMANKSSLLPKGFNLPYYRMHLRPYRHSGQHRMLMAHESAGCLVYYVSPLFHRISELDALYSSGQVWNESIWIEPTRIGELPDDGFHHVAYDATNQNWCLYSEPRRHEFNCRGETLEGRLAHRIPERITTVDTENRLKELLQSMLEAASSQRLAKSDELLVERISGSRPELAVALLAKLYFDCELFLINRIE